MDKYISVSDIENEALDLLPKKIRDYYKSGATEETTLEENRLAFKRLRIWPKCLTGVTKCDLRTRNLGHQVDIPVCIAPSAMQKMAHPHGELANVRAAGDAGTIYILSTLSSSFIEEVAEAAPNAIKWFQLYIYKDRSVTKSLVMRAEKAGFKALILTVDTPLFGLRRADIKNQFALPSHLKLANFDGHLSNKINTSKGGSALNEYVMTLFDKGLTCEDISYLKSITKLPIVAKGILRPDDAVKAAKAGCSAILVSNHGGRQLDGVPATVNLFITSCPAATWSA